MAFYAQKRSVTSHGPTNGSATVAFVHDFPTRTDLEKGIAWHPESAAYQLIARGLRHNGIDASSCFWTHAVLNGGVASDKKAALQAAKARRPQLLEELASCGASWVVPTGRLALKMILGLKKSPDFLKGWRGSISYRGFQHVAPILHPNFCFTTPKWMPWLRNDVNRLGRLVAAGGWTPPEQHATITIGSSVDAVRGWLAEHENHLAAASDVETVGLGPTRTGLVCYGLGVTGAALVIPWSRGANGAEPWWSPKERDAVVDAVNHYFTDRYAVSHNGPAFDHIVLQRHGFITPLWHDTLLMSHAGQSHMPKSLAHLATTWLDVGPWKHVDHASSIEQLWFYNAQDVIYTIGAFHAMVEEQGWPTNR